MDTDAMRAQLLGLKAEIARRVKAIGRDLNRENGPLSSDFSDQGIELENHEVLNALGASGEQELGQINTALARLDSGDYGICSSCAEPIQEARLKALPFVLHCVKCAARLEASV